MSRTLNHRLQLRTWQKRWHSNVTSNLSKNRIRISWMRQISWCQRHLRNLSTLVLEMPSNVSSASLTRRSNSSLSNPSSRHWRREFISEPHRLFLIEILEMGINQRSPIWTSPRWRTTSSQFSMIPNQLFGESLRRVIRSQMLMQDITKLYRCFKMIVIILLRNKKWLRLQESISQERIESGYDRILILLGERQLEMM